MSVPARLLAVALSAVAARAVASAELDAHVETVVAENVHVRLVVDNRGDDAARAIAPDIRFRLTERHPDPAPMLRPGAQHVFEATFPKPPTPGTDSLIVQLRYRDTLGRDASVPYATTVTSGDTAGPVRLALASGDPARLPTVLARLSHDEQQAIRGRLIIVVPDGYYTEPGSQAVDIPPGDGLDIPFMPQRLRGPVDARIPIAGVVQYELAGVRRAAAATTTLRPGPSPAPPPVAPLLVGAIALGVAIACVAVALGVSARRRRSAPA
jgi:hypothetical protein